jgi:hypothetical protein
MPDDTCSWIGLRNCPRLGARIAAACWTCGDERWRLEVTCSQVALGFCARSVIAAVVAAVLCSRRRGSGGRDDGTGSDASSRWPPSTGLGRCHVSEQVTCPCVGDGTAYARVYTSRPYASSGSFYELVQDHNHDYDPSTGLPKPRPSGSQGGLATRARARNPRTCSSKPANRLPPRRGHRTDHRLAGEPPRQHSRRTGPRRSTSSSPREA